MTQSPSFENFVAGKSAEQVIRETIEDLDRGIFDKGEHQRMIAELESARLLTPPDSAERIKIDELLGDIEARYGDL